MTYASHRGHAGTSDRRFLGRVRAEPGTGAVASARAAGGQELGFSFLLFACPGSSLMAISRKRLIIGDFSEQLYRFS